uniref:Ig-like domain-containing protein n=1 Tax=Chrysemys picta bellii TaxID=8478 RepID=A0A8C3HUN0_CHRPI
GSLLPLQMGCPKHLLALLVPRAAPALLPQESLPAVLPLGTGTAVCQGVRFVLNKEGRHFQPVDSNGFEVVFPISNVSREHGGSYSCSYHSRSEPFGVSYPSDPVELVTYYPKPSISLRPSGGVALGGAVTIRCRGWYQNVRFLLYKDGNPNAVQYAEPAGDLAEFPISNVSRRDAGSYSCYYHHKWYPFIWSYPSDPVELVVAGEGPGSVSPIPAPHPAGPSGQRHVQGRKQAQAPRISGSGPDMSGGIRTNGNPNLWGWTKEHYRGAGWLRGQFNCPGAPFTGETEAQPPGQQNAASPEGSSPREAPEPRYLGDGQRGAGPDLPDGGRWGLCSQGSTCCWFPVRATGVTLPFPQQQPPRGAQISPAPTSPAWR